MRTRDLDRLNRKIARLLGRDVFRAGQCWYIRCGDISDTYGRESVPDYARDLNVCVAACEKAGRHWIVYRQEDGKAWGKVTSPEKLIWEQIADAPTPALALALALLAALEARRGSAVWAARPTARGAEPLVAAEENEKGEGP